MAKAVSPHTWQRGFREPASGTPWQWGPDENDGPEQYVTPPSKEVVSSPVHNDLGINVQRTWPTLYDGTNNPHGIPDWWKPASEVDVLICGAGPSGLEVALSLVRQGVSFRIIDKAEGPLDAGRADGVQPRFLEILNSWGLAKEVAEEGPIIERTAIYKDGKKLWFSRSHQCDSRYRGLHIITQGQVERIYIRDLMRHRVLVERNSTLKDFHVSEDQPYPVQMTLKNERTGAEETIKAKFLVGSDGAASMIRKKLSIPFDGMSTDIYWGIMDCVFESDYPHAWVFGSVISSKHGGCVIIPREDGYIRLYTQLDVSQTGPIAASRQAKDPSFAEAGGRVDVHSITPEEVLEQANRIFSPYKLRFASSLSCHVHSVMGAFGLNASIMDSSNLAWKMGLVAQNKARLETLMPTYNLERREHACRIIETSGEYLRFVCATDLSIANVRNPEGAEVRTDGTTTNGTTKNGTIANGTATNGTNKPQTREDDLKFLSSFFARNGQFLLGVDAPFHASVLTPAQAEQKTAPPLAVNNGVRAPNPRVCFSTNETGYLYDVLAGAARFHLVLFASTLGGREVRRQLCRFAEKALSPDGFYHRYGGTERFNLVLVVKRLPWEMDEVVGGSQELEALRKCATVVYDDRAPDEDAHTTWGVNHRTGALAIVRPDLWVGMGVQPGEVERVEEYFGGFLLSCKARETEGM
ncbi:Monooxygenase FAD-binding protein [Lasiodiplodia theobromae]|uniref:Monooxygenase FAD-binding protein n=1 Tax=Lasiodiplodia theobromae TaxID=45133 RepID=UPI0015C3A970|nr:Monooxygenase FAD-binding protein [Lasiodiplodia theobromae]KAF4543313.1 Monooxygenase FAD-binding protein [Lasiodiplodia theobromae]